MSRKIIVQLEAITDNYTTAALVDLANVLVQDKWLLVFIKTIRTRTEPGKAIFQIEVTQKLHVLTLQKLHRSANLPADLFNLLHGQMEQIAAADASSFGSALFLPSCAIKYAAVEYIPVPGSSSPTRAMRFANVLLIIAAGTDSGLTMMEK